MSTTFCPNCNRPHRICKCIPSDAELAAEEARVAPQPEPDALSPLEKRLNELLTDLYARLATLESRTLGEGGLEARVNVADVMHDALERRVKALEKWERLRAAGWVKGTAEQFLGLEPGSLDAAPADPVRDAERAVIEAAMDAADDSASAAMFDMLIARVSALRAARENKNTAQRERRDVGEKTEGSDDVLGQPSHYERRTPDSEPSNASTTEGRILPGRTTSEVRAESPAVLGPVAHGAPHSAGVDHPQAETFPPSPAPVAPAPRCPKCQHLPGPLPMPKDIEKDYRLVWSCPCDCHAPAPQWTEPTREALIRGIADALHTDIDGRYECQRCPVAADAAAALYAPELAGLRADRDANREIKMRLAAQSDRLASEKRTLSEDVDSLRDILETRNEQIAALKADMSTCYSAKSQAIQRADAHAAEATELRKRWADRASIPACAYCEWEGDLSDTEGLRVQAKAHVATCQKHPQRALESEARDLRARVETLTKAGRELNEACQRDIEAIRAEAPPARRSGDVEACAKELREHWIKTRACQTPYHDDFAAILLKHFPLPAAREVTVTAEDVGEAIKKHMDWLTSRAAQTAIAADLTARLRSAKDKSDAT